MRGKHSVIFLLCALIIGCRENGIVETKYGNGRLSERFTTAKDSTGQEMEVKHESWYKNGHKKKYEEFNKGKRNGLSIAWHENGQMKDSTNFIEGVETDGKKVGWHKNGQKKYEYEVKNGAADWKYSEWYESGKVLQEVDYKNGQPTGRLNLWYESGKRMGEYKIENLSEVEYKNAPPAYTYHVWYESGNKKSEWSFGPPRIGLEWYENGNKKGEWRLEGSTGNKTALQSGKWTEWDENGKITKEDVYKNGVKIK